MPQPSPAPAKSENQATPATKKAEPKTASTKAEPMPGPAKSQPPSVPIEAVPTVSTVKADVESTSVKTITMATAAPTQTAIETTLLPTTEELSKQPLTVEAVTPKVDAPDIIVTKKVPMENKEEVPRTDIKSEESKPDLSKAKVEASVAKPSSFPVPDASVVPAPPVAAEAAVAEVVPETQTKPDLSVPERIIKMVDTDDCTNLTESSKSLQKVRVQPESQEGEVVIATDSKETVVKSTDKITISTLESQPVSTSIKGKVRHYAVY